MDREERAGEKEGCRGEERMVGGWTEGERRDRRGMERRKERERQKRACVVWSGVTFAVADNMM